jgi:S-adenosylmethionine-diacylglycerol 3-amino-3-carboxypropyl transferase
MPESAVESRGNGRHPGLTSAEPRPHQLSLRDRFGNFWFQMVHRHNLVYNTCWEDPRLDRVALELGPEDEVLVITSAGCNALDYALQAPRRVHCVDLNPRQNSLLALKLAGIKALNHSDFFSLFGDGATPRCREIYEDALRPQLQGFARRYWDRRIGFFRGTRGRQSFYFRGTAGYFARTINRYADRVLRVREGLNQLLAATTVAEQAEIYHRELRPVIWNRLVRWFVGRDTTLSLLGVPRPQREQVETTYHGGIPRFIEDCVEAVFTQLPIHDNYFWRVYLTGHYTPTCCPEYLKPQNFEALKAGLASRIDVHTNSVAGFLQQHPSRISRFVLLDHMDWLSTNRRDLLAEEWQTLLDRATPDVRFLWRSGGTNTRFIDHVPVRWQGSATTVGELLTYDRELADRLHPLDRVHTYGHFAIARLADG